jgi:hypothetical protein
MQAKGRRQLAGDAPYVRERVSLQRSDRRFRLGADRHPLTQDSIAIMRRMREGEPLIFTDPPRSILRASFATCFQEDVNGE